MKQFLTFLTKIKSFWKFYRNYEYDGETAEFIVENYQDVLQNRTKLMSYPTYYAKDVIEQIDKWYEEEYLISVRLTNNKFANRIDFSVEYSDLINSDEFPRVIFDKIMELSGKGND